MKQTKDQRYDAPSTVKQLAAAMTALGKYAGENSDAEHAAEARRLGGMDIYRARLANALLGIVEIDAILADSVGTSTEQMEAAHAQALTSAGIDDPAQLLHFLRWRTVRVEGPLRKIAQNAEVGPLPLAAAHAAEGLRLLLGICAAAQNLETASLGDMTGELKTARAALTDAVANIDQMQKLLDQAEDRFHS